MDQETEYMMFEPDERVWNEKRKGDLNNSSYYLIGAIDGGKIVGFLSAEREIHRRNRHSAFIVTGIRKEYCHKGIGTQFFERLDKWTKENRATRLELTAEMHNIAAINLYKKRLCYRGDQEAYNDCLWELYR